MRPDLPDDVWAVIRSILLEDRPVPRHAMASALFAFEQALGAARQPPAEAPSPE